MEKTKLIIENCEEQSEWLLLEYEHCIQLWENIAFTNIKRGFEELKEKANCYEKHFYEIFGNSKKIIILDPLAEEELKTNDFKNCNFIVVGGILGNKEFTGKTKKLISEKINCKKRNLGKIQLSIDTSVFIAKLIYLGKKLKEIELTREVEIFLSKEHSITLPYGYPIINGKLILTPKLIEYLRN